MKNKEKYDLSKLELDSLTYDGDIKYMVVYEETSSGIKRLFEKQYTKHVYPYQLLVDFANWLEQEYDPKILDDVEKAYLSAVIKPFRKNVECIEKIKTYSGGKEYISITMKKYYDSCELPVFKKGTMYKGMETDKAYTLEELGL